MLFVYGYKSMKICVKGIYWFGWLEIFCINFKVKFNLNEILIGYFYEIDFEGDNFKIIIKLVNS